MGWYAAIVTILLVVQYIRSSQTVYQQSVQLDYYRSVCTSDYQTLHHAYQKMVKLVELQKAELKIWRNRNV